MKWCFLDKWREQKPNAASPLPCCSITSANSEKLKRGEMKFVVTVSAHSTVANLKMSSCVLLLRLTGSPDWKEEKLQQRLWTLGLWFVFPSLSRRRSLMAAALSTLWPEPPLMALLLWLCWLVSCRTQAVSVDTVLYCCRLQVDVGAVHLWSSRNERSKRSDYCRHVRTEYLTKTTIINNQKFLWSGELSQLWSDAS